MDPGTRLLTRIFSDASCVDRLLARLVTPERITFDNNKISIGSFRGRGHRNDRAATSLPHRRQYRTDHASRAQQGKFKCILPVLVRKVIESSGRRPAGINHQTIHTAKTRAGILEPSDNRIAIARVKNAWNYFRPDLFSQFTCSLVN